MRQCARGHVHAHRGSGRRASRASSAPAARPATSQRTVQSGRRASRQQAAPAGAAPRCGAPRGGVVHACRHRAGMRQAARHDRGAPAGRSRAIRCGSRGSGSALRDDATHLVVGVVEHRRERIGDARRWATRIRTSRCGSSRIAASSRCGTRSATCRRTVSSASSHQRAAGGTGRRGARRWRAPRSTGAPGAGWPALDARGRSGRCGAHRRPACRCGRARRAWRRAAAHAAQAMQVLAVMAAPCQSRQGMSSGRGIVERRSRGEAASCWSGLRSIPSATAQAGRLAHAAAPVALRGANRVSSSSRSSTPSVAVRDGAPSHGFEQRAADTVLGVQRTQQSQARRAPRCASPRRRLR